MKLEIELSDEEALWLENYARSLTPAGEFCTHGPLTLQKLVAMLLEDVALTQSRPGSWEGAHMMQVLRSHGYG